MCTPVMCDAGGSYVSSIFRKFSGYMQMLQSMSGLNPVQEPISLKTNRQQGRAPCGHALSLRPRRAVFPRYVRIRGPYDKRGPATDWPLATSAASTRLAEARRSEAHHRCRRELRSPAHRSRASLHADVCAMRTSSCTCMKRFSKMFSLTWLTPSACVSRAMYCACMSVGKPGYSR